MSGLVYILGPLDRSSVVNQIEGNPTSTTSSVRHVTVDQRLNDPQNSSRRRNQQRFLPHQDVMSTYFPNVPANTEGYEDVQVSILSTESGVEEGETEFHHGQTSSTGLYITGFRT